MWRAACKEQGAALIPTHLAVRDVVNLVPSILVVSESAATCAVMALKVVYALHHVRGIHLARTLVDDPVPDLGGGEHAETAVRQPAVKGEALDDRRLGDGGTRGKGEMQF